MKIMKKKWTLILCQEDAKRFETRTEWFNKGKKSYAAAQRNGWLAKCTGHMKDKRGGVRGKIAPADE